MEAKPDVSKGEIIMRTMHKVHCTKRDALWKDTAKSTGKKASSAKRKKGKHVKKVKLALCRIFRQIPRKGLHKYPILYS